MDGSGTHEGPGQFHDQDSRVVDRLLFILTAVINSGRAGLMSPQTGRYFRKRSRSDATADKLVCQMLPTVFSRVRG